jgi:PKD repeat protein
MNEPTRLTPPPWEGDPLDITAIIKDDTFNGKVGINLRRQLGYSEYGTSGEPNFNRPIFRIFTTFAESSSTAVINTFTGLPAGLSINSQAILSGVPKTAGFYKISFFQTVLDINIRNSVDQRPRTERLNGTLKLQVARGNPILLTLSAITSASTDTDQLFEFSTSSDYYAGTITAASVLPSGLFFENNRLKGRHPTAGTFRAEVVFTGPSNESFSKNIDIFNYEAAPSIFTTELSIGKVGQGYSSELLVESATSPAESWAATGLPLGLIFSNGKISGTPSVFGNFNVVFTATNPLGTDSKTLPISISVGAPSISSQTFSLKKSQATTQAIALENATNRPVDSWSASGLPTGLAINSATGIVTGTPSESGKYTSTIFAIGPGGSVSSEIVFFVRQAFSGKVGDEFSASLQTFDPRLATLWGVVSGLPAGLSVNPDTGEITGTPTTAGSFLVTIKITIKSSDEIFRDLDFEIAYGAPIIAPDQQLNAALNVPFARTPALEDAANRQATTWTALGLPDWATINPATGEITGTPTSDHGPITASLAATGPGGTSDEVDIIFDTTGGIPILVPNQVFHTKVGLAVTPFTPESVDSANRPILSWQALGLPPGLVINLTTGEITGTPLLAGTKNASLRVTGEGGSTATASIIFQVDFGAPLLQPNQNCLFKFGVPFTKTFTLQNATNRPVASWSATGLPDWAVLDSAQGQLTGDAASIGISTFTLTATGAGGSASEVITLAISAGVPKLTAGESVAGIATAFLSFNPTPVDTTNRPITSWSAKGLPAGVSISTSTGEISGTPLVFWSAPAKITAAGPGGSATEELIFDISRLPRTTNVRIYAVSNRFPLEVSGSRKVQVFSTNLVMVSLEYLVPRNDEYLYSQQFKVGTPLLTDSPAVDGLFIFPASSRQDMGDGFVKFMVSAYGRSSTEWNSSPRFVSLGRAQTFLTAVTLADEPFPWSVLGELGVISTNINNYGRFNEFEIVAQ